MRTLLALCVLSLFAAGCATPAVPSDAQQSGSPGPGDPGGTAETRSWPPIAQATIRPGVQLGYPDPTDLLFGPGCTSNFVFQDVNGSGLYIGTAAHCFEADNTVPSVSASGEGHCGSVSLPLGTQVEIDGAEHPGTLVYSSILAMQDRGETTQDVCTENDFALVSIHPDDYARVHPAMKGWLGPTGDLNGTLSVGASVLTFGATGYRQGVESLDKAKGAVQDVDHGGWRYLVKFDSPRLPGDSGSAVTTEDGLAFGIITTLTAGGNNGVEPLALVMRYVAESSPLDVELATWSGDSG